MQNTNLLTLRICPLLDVVAEETTTSRNALTSKMKGFDTNCISTAVMITSHALMNQLSVDMQVCSD